MQKWLAGDFPYYVKIYLYLTYPISNTDFQFEQ